MAFLLSVLVMTVYALVLLSHQGVVYIPRSCSVKDFKQFLDAVCVGLLEICRFHTQAPVLGIDFCIKAY